MALVEKMVASNGVPVEFFDDCYAGISAEEEARRERAFNEAFARQNYINQLRQLKERQEAAKARSHE